jgi:hypothetical protein
MAEGMDMVITTTIMDTTGTITVIQSLHSVLQWLWDPLLRLQRCRQAV